MRLCLKKYVQMLTAFLHRIFIHQKLQIVAQKYNAKLLTRDKKLAKISAEMNIEVISY